MRKLDLRYAKQLHDQLRPKMRVNPHPFPGPFPTRVAFEATFYRYVGKPSNYALRILENCPYIQWYVEFDQKNAIYSTCSKFDLWRFYHPGIVPGMVLNWWPKTEWNRGMLVFSRKYRVYRPKGYYMKTVRELLAADGYKELLHLEEEA